MHLINRSFLKLALLPTGVYQRMGVDTAHLKAILTTKLTMDDRRPNTLQQTRQRKSDKPVKAATLGTILVSAVIGLVYLFAFAIGKNDTTHFTFYFTFFFFMLAASLISDFTAVLIDVRDNYIILPKPVSDKTVVTARILHIFIHICKLVVPMALPGLVYVLINYSIAGGLYFILLVLLLTLFVIFFINALYMLILRLTTPAKFQSVISYIQIFFAIALYASYQILPRLADRLGILDFDATTQPGLFVLPMYWFASAWNTLYTLRAGGLEVLFLSLCFVVPLLSLFIVIKYLAPSFNNKLALLNSVSTDVPKPAAVKTKRTNSLYLTTMSRLFTKPGAERMGFLFTSKMTARSREFKVKVYPAIGYLLVIVVMMFLGKRRVNIQNFNKDNGRILIISALYITSLLLITAITQMTQSEKFKAGWFYFTAPLQKPGAVISGALKAALCKFYVPVIVLLTLGSLIFIGPSVLPNIMLGLFNQLLITMLIVYGNKKVFPFSLPQNNNAKAGAFLKNFFLAAISGAIGISHYLVYNIMPVVIIFACLSALATWLLLSSIKETGWEKIQSAYAGT